MPTLSQWREDVLAPVLRDTLGEGKRIPVEPFPTNRLQTGVPAAVIYQGYDGAFIEEADPDLNDYCRHAVRFSVLLVSGEPFRAPTVARIDRWVELLPKAMKAARPLVAAYADGDGIPRVRSISAPFLIDYAGGRYMAVVVRIAAAHHYEE